MKFLLLCWLLKKRKKAACLSEMAASERERKSRFNESTSRADTCWCHTQDNRKNRLLDNGKKSEIPFRSNCDCYGLLRALDSKCTGAWRAECSSKLPQKPTEAETLVVWEVSEWTVKCTNKTDLICESSLGRVSSMISSWTITEIKLKTLLDDQTSAWRHSDC